MRLRTFDGERIKGEVTTEYPASKDGNPILLVNGKPFEPEEADFFLESATLAEVNQLEEGRYDLPRWREFGEEEESPTDGK